MKLPKEYAWLQEIGTLPKTIQEGLKVFGTIETPGKKNNPTIMAWATECGLQQSYTGDETAWCGLFAAVVCKRAGKPVIAGPLWARNWSKFGTAAPHPSLGDVMVFERPGGGGHVSFYIAEDAVAYHVLGGNQSDAVTVTRILKTRCIAARRPPMTTPPASLKPYHVASTGALSKNEA